MRGNLTLCRAINDHPSIVYPKVTASVKIKIISDQKSFLDASSGIGSMNKTIIFPKKYACMGYEAPKRAISIPFSR